MFEKQSDGGDPLAHRRARFRACVCTDVLEAFPPRPADSGGGGSSARYSGHALSGRRWRNLARVSASFGPARTQRRQLAPAQPRCCSAPGTRDWREHEAEFHETLRRCGTRRWRVRFGRGKEAAERNRERILCTHFPGVNDDRPAQCRPCADCRPCVTGGAGGADFVGLVSTPPVFHRGRLGLNRVPQRMSGYHAN